MNVHQTKGYAGKSVRAEHRCLPWDKLWLCSLILQNMSVSQPVPSRIVVHQKSRLLELEFDDGQVFNLPFELMRVYSPSAEVRGHGPGQETLQVGKRDVQIHKLEPVGMYAVKPVFSDGHDSGLFSWEYLHWLGSNHEGLWNDYLQRLKDAGASRDPDAPENTPFQAAPKGGCGNH